MTVSGGTVTTRIGRVEAVVNCASGSVGRAAPAEVEKIFAEAGVSARIAAPEPEGLMDALARAVDAGPDVLVVLAGDGTARAAAELCGPEGPILAPLPGGTMNMLPHAVYGQVPWQQALKAALSEGRPRNVGGGEVAGRTFMVAAILGSPALWAPAREAARMGKPTLALLRAQRALKRAFSGRLRYALDDAEREKAEALVFMCPIVSKAVKDEAQYLEAAGVTPAGAADAFRLGLHAVLGDWRNDPAVVVEHCRLARIWSSGRIPGILDGEPVRLDLSAEVRFRPSVVRLLAPPKGERT
ncbi:diacylglycerol/lipid kinase family protein [Phenylobacterium sp.]|uniref:diacylglycerol/lipid kinase family protein n=1 Tax=Phenylobacterium sp. TaxID=1871053 RepID=UPI002F41635D